MLHTNYQYLLNSLSTKNKGFWRLEAIAKLTKKIQKGEDKWTYLRDLLKTGEKKEDTSFLQITSSRSLPKLQTDALARLKSKSSQTFFVTQIKPYYHLNFRKNFNDKIFMNLDEELMYSPINLHPFEIKYARRRDPNQRLFNIQELQKEIENNYDKIRNEQKKIKRPYTSFCINNKLKNKIRNNENKNIGKFSNRINTISANPKKMDDIRKEFLIKNEGGSNTVPNEKTKHIHSASVGKARNKIIKNELNQLLKAMKNEKNSSFQITIKNTNFFSNKENRLYEHGKNFAKLFNNLRKKYHNLKFNQIDFIGNKRNNIFQSKKIISKPSYFDKISTIENTVSKSNLNKINSFLKNKNKD